MNLKVLESITDVDGTESIGASLMEELIAGPLERPDHNWFTTFIHLEGPTAARLVFGGRFKESLVKWSCGQIQLGTLGCILHISEVKVAFEAHAISTIQTSEGLISANLMLWRHLKGANGANLAVILNSVNHGG